MVVVLSVVADSMLGLLSDPGLKGRKEEGRIWRGPLVVRVSGERTMRSRRSTKVKKSDRNESRKLKQTYMPLC